MANQEQSEHLFPIQMVHFFLMRTNKNIELTSKMKRSVSMTNNKDSFIIELANFRHSSYRKTKHIQLLNKPNTLDCFFLLLSKDSLTCFYHLNNTKDGMGKDKKITSEIIIINVRAYQVF